MKPRKDPKGSSIELSIADLDAVSGGDDLSSFMQRDNFNRAYHNLPGAFGESPMLPNGGELQVWGPSSFADPNLRGWTDVLIAGPGDGPNPLASTPNGFGGNVLDDLKTMRDAYDRGTPDPLFPEGNGPSPEQILSAPPAPYQTTDAGSEPGESTVASTDTDSSTDYG